MAYKIKCSEVWGGMCGDELDVQSNGIRASLFSKEGGNRGDVYYFSQCGDGLLTRIAIAEVQSSNDASVVEEASQWFYNKLVNKMDLQIVRKS